MKLLLSLIIIIFWSGRIDTPNSVEKPATATYCDVLNQIIIASRNNFKPIRGQAIQNDNGFWRNVYWKSTVSLPGAKDCRITENLFTSCDCTMGRWESYSPQVQQDYDKIVNNVKQCLPDGWQIKEHTNINSSIRLMECQEERNNDEHKDPAKTKIQIRLFKIAENAYQIDFKAIAPLSD